VARQVKLADQDIKPHSMPTDVRDWTRLHEVEAMARHQLQDATKQDVRRQSPTSPFLASRCVRHCEIKDNVARGEIAW